MGELVGARQRPAERQRSRAGLALWSGRGLQGDLVAEGFELADVVALAALGVDPSVVEVAAQVGVAGGGVGEQVPDDDQQGPADGHDGFLAAPAAGDPPVPLAQEGVGAGGGGGGVAENPGQVAVAVPGGVLAFLLPGGLLDAGGELGPGDQVPGGGEAAHVGADLGQDRVGGGGADAGDLRQAPGCRDRKSTRLNSSHVRISYAVFCLKKKKKKK